MKKKKKRTSSICRPKVSEVWMDGHPPALESRGPSLALLLPSRRFILSQLWDNATRLWLLNAVNYFSSFRHSGMVDTMFGGECCGKERNSTAVNGMVGTCIYE